MTEYETEETFPLPTLLYCVIEPRNSSGLEVSEDTLSPQQAFCDTQLTFWCLDTCAVWRDHGVSRCFQPRPWSL